MMNTASLLNNVRTLAVVCTQWGDTGKGKFVDLFAEWADVIVRGTGGANAGHTISIGGKTYVFHLVPSGILRDADGKINIIGNGVAFDPRVVSEELAVLQGEGRSFGNLRIAYNAKLVLPQHILIDRLRESESGEGKIGTTGRGIGPCYVDHYARIGLTVNDLLNRDVFVRKLRRNLASKMHSLLGADRDTVRQILEHPHLLDGKFYSPQHLFDVDAVVETYLAYGSELAPLIYDTDELVASAMGKKRILLEGAQGNLLSIDYGTYPYVTSSECSLQGLTKGAGLAVGAVDLTLGIVKAFYMTRVGKGPFPSELGGARSERWCNNPDVNRDVELKEFPDADVNGDDAFLQGVAIRQAGNEYGATTARPRRIGWEDLPILRYSRRLTGPNVILTKLDVLSGCETIKVCRAYQYRGEAYRIGQKTLTTNGTLEVAVPDYDVLSRCEPLYAHFSGWRRDIRGMKTFDELPRELRALIDFLEKAAHVNVVLLSVGPDRDETIAVTALSP